jgi:hypothetical protein
VGHLRHSHAFLARLRAIIRDGHPELLADLMACRLPRPALRGRPDGPAQGQLPAAAVGRRPGGADQPAHDPGAGDPPLRGARQANIEVVERLRARTRACAGPVPHVTGVVVDARTVLQTLSADIVVDAAGRTSGCVEQLVAAGATIPEETEDCGILYFTRHYRLNRA